MGIRATDIRKGQEVWVTYQRPTTATPHPKRRLATVVTVLRDAAEVKFADGEGHTRRTVRLCDIEAQPSATDAVGRDAPRPKPAPTLMRAPARIMRESERPEPDESNVGDSPDDFQAWMDMAASLVAPLRERSDAITARLAELADVRESIDREVSDLATESKSIQDKIRGVEAVTRLAHGT